MKLRLALAAACAVAMLIVVPSGASAQVRYDQLNRSIPVKGTVSDGVPATPDQTFSGKYRIRRFKAEGGKLLAVGRLTGEMGGREISRVVEWPVTMRKSARSAQAGSCRILFLDLAPLHLDLLGLQIDLSRVVLRITAVRGAGNLLGNLLCAIVGILDPQTAKAVVRTH
jgi:hypothetical protein